MTSFWVILLFFLSYAFVLSRVPYWISRVLGPVNKGLGKRSVPHVGKGEWDKHSPRGERAVAGKRSPRGERGGG